MKKIGLFTLLLLALIALFSLGSAGAETLDIERETTLWRPASLLGIEDEAFSGTSVKTVVFPEGFLYLGSNAFENAKALTDAYISPSTKYISDSAFPLNDALTIHGAKDSYAQDWAEKHKVRFVVEDIWKALPSEGRFDGVRKNRPDSGFWEIPPARDGKYKHRADAPDESKRPQDRPELHPIDYRFP